MFVSKQKQKALLSHNDYGVSYKKKDHFFLNQRCNASSTANRPVTRIICIADPALIPLTILHQNIRRDLHRMHAIQMDQTIPIRFRPSDNRSGIGIYLRDPRADKLLDDDETVCVWRAADLEGAGMAVFKDIDVFFVGKGVCRRVFVQDGLDGGVTDANCVLLCVLDEGEGVDAQDKDRYAHACAVGACKVLAGVVGAQV